MEERQERKTQKSYFDVLGLCCPAEAVLVEKILKPLHGIQKISVIVPSRTVIVVHDGHIISTDQIVKALNQAGLEASLQTYGNRKLVDRWPSPFIIAAGLLLLVSLFQRFWHPLKWFALAAANAGLIHILKRAYAAVRRCTIDINMLMLIAVVGSIALKDYSEAGFIVFLFMVAEWLETMASHKATDGMASLMTPQKAMLAGTGEEVSALDVQIGTLIAVKAGEMVPIDGTVVEGKSEVDESSLTGEPFPVAKQAGSQVFAGTLNIDGFISVRTTTMAENSTVTKMAKLVEEAQNKRSDMQRMIDTIAKYYTPAVVLVAVGFAAIPAAMKVHNIKYWIQLALVVLVSACPCALVLSTPIATFCALKMAARSGLLIKGGDVLEALAKVKVAAFDKTGTITKGKFCMKDQTISDAVSTQKLLYWVSSIESKSSHPMASALVEYAKMNSIEPNQDDVKEFNIYPGEGIYGEIDGKCIYIGNKRIILRASSDADPEEMNTQGATIAYVICDREIIAKFILSDSCRTGSAEALAELKSRGLKTVMLTGDCSASAKRVQAQLGNIFNAVHSELLPEDKVRFIEDSKTTEGPTLMVGDGMNDAPALAAATVGISMGLSGSAVAMETSHVTLMSDDIRKILTVIKLAHRTHLTIKINIIVSVITKVAVLALAFAGHPLLWAAVLADVGTCLLVSLNSMLLLKEQHIKLKKCCESVLVSHDKSPGLVNHCSQDSCESKKDSQQSSNSCCSSKHTHCSEKGGRANGSTEASTLAHCRSPSTDAKCHTNGRDSHSVSDVEIHRASPKHAHCATSRHPCHGTHGTEEASHAYPGKLRKHAHCHQDPVNDEASQKLSTKPRKHAHFHLHAREVLRNTECSAHEHPDKKSIFHHKENKDISENISRNDHEMCCAEDVESCSITEQREVRGCCRSYRDECRRREACGSGCMATLTEIVIE